MKDLRSMAQNPLSKDLDMNGHLIGGNSEADIDDAVAKKHTQNTDQYLDYGGANQVAVADAADAVTKKHTQNSDTKLQDGAATPIDSVVVNTGGIVDLPKQSIGQIYKSTAQTIADSTYTKVSLDTEGIDNQNEVDIANNRITFLKAGNYLIIGQVKYSVLSASAHGLLIGIYKNGSEPTPAIRNQLADSYYPAPNGAGLIDAITGDYVELYTYQNSGASQDLNADPIHFLVAIKVG